MLEVVRSDGVITVVSQDDKIFDGTLDKIFDWIPIRSAKSLHLLHSGIRPHHSSAPRAAAPPLLRHQHAFQRERWPTLTRALRALMPPLLQSWERPRPWLTYNCAARKAPGLVCRNSTSNNRRMFTNTPRPLSPT